MIGRQAGLAVAPRKLVLPADLMALQAVSTFERRPLFSRHGVVLSDRSVFR